MKKILLGLLTKVADSTFAKTEVVNTFLWRKSMKHILCVICTLIGTWAWADLVAQDVKRGDITYDLVQYKVDWNNYTYYAHIQSIDGEDVVIPSTITYKSKTYKVTNMPSSENCKCRSLVFPPTITAWNGVSDPSNFTYFVSLSTTNPVGMTNRDFYKYLSLKKAVYHSDVPVYGIINSFLINVCDSIYFPLQYSNNWEKVLKNSGYGGKRVCFTGTWPDIQEVMVNGRKPGYKDPPVSVTNYVFSTVSNHVYHHDVVTDLTAYHTTVTNVYVHYVNENAKPTFIFPSEYDTGFVNVVAEVEGGYAVIPATWSVNFPGFTQKYGTDFSKALSKHNDKFDQRGNPMYVWQDYVAGTNPMDPSDVFHATIAIENGQVSVSHSPVLDEARAALRTYTVYGKKNLMDSEWKVVEPGEELDYNFYRVTVRMKQSE